MVHAGKVQIVGGYDRLMTAAYSSAWKRLTLGGTYYWKQNRLKLQTNYIFHWGFLGAAGVHPRAFVTQMQIVF